MSKQVISREYIDKQVIYCLFPANALQPLGDGGKFQDNFANTAGIDSTSGKTTPCQEK